MGVMGDLELGAAGTAAKEALFGYTGDCNCHEAYTSRNRTDPSCWYHNVEGADEDILTAAIPHLHRAWLEGLIAELDGLHKRSIAHSMGRSSNWSTAAGALRDLRAEIAELEGVGE